MGFTKLTIPFICISSGFGKPQIIWLASKVSDEIGVFYNLLGKAVNPEVFAIYIIEKIKKNKYSGSNCSIF
jgi:hypothetical protein